MASRRITHSAAAVANGNVQEWGHPVIGKSLWPGFVVQFLETPLEIGTAAPELGEHSEEILLDLGYGWEEIDTLRRQRVI